MDELSAKIEKLEQLKKEKEEKQREEEGNERAKLKSKAQGNKNFLGNIKSFDIEDI